MTSANIKTTFGSISIHFGTDEELEAALKKLPKQTGTINRAIGQGAPPEAVLDLELKSTACNQ